MAVCPFLIPLPPIDSIQFILHISSGYLRSIIHVFEEERIMWSISPDGLMIIFCLVAFVGLSLPHFESWWCWLRNRLSRRADHGS